MRKFLLFVLAAATAMPAVAVATPAAAQSRHEVRRDRHEVRQQRRDVRRARRHGDRHDVRRERRDLRHARRELRQDRRDHRQARRDYRRERRWDRHDWRDWRRDHRRVYRRGSWRAPFRYHTFRTGIRIAPVYYSSRYYIDNPYYYHLPTPGYYQRWVRHYDDVLLIDIRTGMVLDVIRNFYW
jgi:Ni/Co efflux regulator RcnB